jgi:hypothetical protein
MDPTEAILAELKALRQEVSELRAKVTAPAMRSLTITQACIRLNCAPRQIFRLLERGELTRGKKIGRETTITLASLEALGAPSAAEVRALQEVSLNLPRGFDAERESAEVDALLRSIPTSRRANRQTFDRPPGVQGHARAAKASR